MNRDQLKQIQIAADTVYREMNPTSQISWPLLNEQLGTELWVKHENHTATGAFKMRGGITYLDWLSKTARPINGIITATRGNHGQSQARAASYHSLRSTIVVPRGNSVEKNNAMRAFGAELIEHGTSFDDAKIKAVELAEREGLSMVPAYHDQLVLGVASYAYELFSQVHDLDVVYVPIGCGSGVCATIKVRDAMGLHTEVVGVVSAHADAAKQSFEAGRIIKTAKADTFADGMAVKEPISEAFEVYSKGLSRVVSVADSEVAKAVRLYFSCTHNVAEGAGAASLAAALQEKRVLKGKRVAVIFTGGNIDSELFQSVLSGKL